MRGSHMHFYPAKCITTRTMKCRNLSQSPSPTVRRPSRLSCRPRGALLLRTDWEPQPRDLGVSLVRSRVSRVRRRNVGVQMSAQSQLRASAMNQNKEVCALGEYEK
jgi:hypothetical protein